MGGIGGIFHADGAPVDPAALSAMCRSLGHRGARARTLQNGSVGLFCRFFGSDADAFFRSPRLAIAAQCRLDNRQELADRLELLSTKGDAAIIAAAYRRWGCSAAKHLMGAFAFALWDAVEQRLYCARDLVGVRPLYFHYHPRRGFLFGSEIKALLSAGSVPEDVNENRVGDYLEGVCTGETYTFYKEISRLPSGHTLIVDRGGLRIRRYDEISPDSRRPAAAVEAFRERFDEAVRCRLRGCDRVAVTLSGGLDSSAVVATAASLGARLHTFSAVFDDVPECDESGYISDVVEHLSCTEHRLSGGLEAGRAPSELDELMRRLDEPISAPNAYLPARLFRAIGREGFGVALHGHGGDEVVSRGTGYLKELSAARQWRHLGRELRRLSGAYDHSMLPLWLGYVGYGLKQMDGRLPALGSAAARHLYRWSRPAAAPVSVVAEPLARRTRLRDRLRELPHPARAGTERERHRLLVDRPERAYGFEVLDAIAHAWSVEPRYPFWDVRLVGLCLALPSAEKLQDGYGRLVLRRAMSGRLPESVRWRRTKVDFLPNLIHGMTGGESKLIGCAQTCSPIMEAYVDAAAVEVVCRRIAAGDARLEDVASVIRVTLLDHWLQRRIRQSRDRDEYDSAAVVFAS